MIHDERGQVLPLVVGFTLVVFAISGVAADGARAWILRRGLQSSADAAVLAAAAQLDADTFYASGGQSAELDHSAAVAEARRVLATRQLATRSHISLEGDSVRAVVSARMRTSFLYLVGVDELPVVASATAAPVFGDAP